MKRALTIFAVLTVLVSFSWAAAPYHIGIVTETVSQAEDNLRGAELLMSEYGAVSDGGYIQLHG